MEVSKAVRTAYFSALSGISVPVYDVFAAPEGITPPYVLISTQVTNQLTIKRCKRYNTSVLLDIVTRSLDPIGREDAEEIAQEIEDIINPDTFEDLDLSAYGYQLGNTIRENDTDSSLKSDQYYIYRKLVTYNHLIIKN